MKRESASVIFNCVGTNDIYPEAVTKASLDRFLMFNASGVDQNTWHSWMLAREHWPTGIF